MDLKKGDRVKLSENFIKWLKDKDLLFDDAESCIGTITEVLTKPDGEEYGYYVIWEKDPEEDYVSKGNLEKIRRNLCFQGQVRKIK